MFVLGIYPALYSLELPGSVAWYLTLNWENVQ